MVKIPQYKMAVYDLPVMYDELKIHERMTVRAQYATEQGGLCYFCKASLAGKPSRAARAKKIKKKYYPRNFFKFKIHLHHCHKTGLTLGATHAHCNAVLWKYYGV